MHSKMMGKRGFADVRRALRVSYSSACNASSLPEPVPFSASTQSDGKAVEQEKPQRRRLWRCRSSCPLLLAHPSPPRRVATSLLTTSPSPAPLNSA